MDILLKKYSRMLRYNECRHQALGPRSGVPCMPLLVEDGWRRLDDVDGIGGRKGILQALLQGFFEAAAALGPLFLGGWSVVLYLGFVAHTHGSTPCMISTTPGTARAFRGSFDWRAGTGGAAMRVMACIEDMRREARRRVPKMFFEYADHGSYAEETLRANRTDLERIKLRQRVLVDVAQRDLSTTILGERAALPMILAPIGLCGMQWGDGEILACRAAQAAGIPFCLSTMSICAIEDVAAAVDKPFWFQLYVMKDRGFVRALIERAIAAKCGALVLTVDLQVLGQRHCDLRNGMTVPPEPRLRNLIDIATKPAWALSVLRGKRKTFGNLSGYVRGMENVRSLSQWISGQFDPALSWADVEWIRSIW